MSFYITKTSWSGTILSVLASFLLGSPEVKAEEMSGPSAKMALEGAITSVCADTPATGLSIQNAVPQSWLLNETSLPASGPPVRQDIRLVLPAGDELTIEIRLAGGSPRQIRATYYQNKDNLLLPGLLAIADGSCVVRSARKIRFEDEPWVLMDQLEGDMETLRWTETLQAPWPDGTDPGGARVAFVDSGLAYELPLFRDRLARDDVGAPIGYDFWDMDPWPYDGDTARGAFLPVRHGTAVASVFAREAPNAALVPFRYPRPDMSRMADIVARALDDEIRILAMPLGSNSEKDWTDFAEALKDENILAIVSAGNNGRDIDAQPVYPAALNLDNILTVTSADGFGRLAPGSNWGNTSVDLMVPAENIAVTDFRGAAGVTSGSSYAVPRLAALAARLLEKDPDLTALELKALITARAVASPFETEARVAVGWIPDPEKD
ncbi:S8 family serine peptidase [Roseibium sp.]|uniref:S8 family serine peptidase n=1 Tax=Roseibium sp. TaxID=1936156 RepID=UPI003BAB6329